MVSECTHEKDHSERKPCSDNSDEIKSLHSAIGFEKKEIIIMSNKIWNFFILSPNLVYFFFLVNSIPPFGMNVIVYLSIGFGGDLNSFYH